MLIQIKQITGGLSGNGKASLCKMHIARRARDFYELNKSFTISDTGISSEFSAARMLADKINAKRDLIADPENALDACELNAVNLIDEIMHAAIDSYLTETNRNLFEKMESFLSDKIGTDKVEHLLEAYTDSIPPSDDVYSGSSSPKRYIEADDSNKYTLLEDMLVSWIDNKNPAAEKMKELFDDKPLLDKTAYTDMFRLLPDFFRKEPAHSHTRKPLLQTMLDPIQQHPQSLTEQLNYINENWSGWLDGLPQKILRSLDFIKEEQRIRFDPEIFGPGPVEAPAFDTSEDEPEQFSQDLDWMPNVVLVAKNAVVWLDQLSKRLKKDIKTLSDIPDETLTELADRGFNALWLIGIWQRSPASKRIKQIMGNPEAAASAYSLKAYRVDESLGGEEALNILKHRAEAHGIRLACDMVPNHTGLDSEWVCEHPDWFIQRRTPPFPSYKFSGENLSGDSRIRVFLEDGYLNHSDAAVVYLREDAQTGETRCIYHGNDGTHLPWNDTAQLNYLLPEVREAVIKEIIKLAKSFPIIRFDAAMTLAKKHVQRLWYPEPGSGGDIASRSECGMTKSDFNRAFPIEFWREVVDRVQQEAPDTLLLAEAFWMMEGFFVRTLGMHRVYNSAFMNMLKNEDNAKYRESIRNVLEFNPQILKRYVNFMSNPDEETAIAQFGTDDKYFGCCLLMSTLPGTPMFGHGQIEGLSEKYGMEYSRAYHDETPNQQLIERHAREIAPLLKKRRIFSNAEQFRLYDLIDKDGNTNEDVFAYSNRAGNESGLVVFNNRFSEAQGRIHKAADFIGEDEVLHRTDLIENLGLTAKDNSYIIFRDHISKTEYIISTNEVAALGLPISLGAFKYRLFMNFREVVSTAEKPYAELAEHLAGQGAANIEDSLNHWIFRDVIDAFNSAIQPQNSLPASQEDSVDKNLIDRLTKLSASIAHAENLQPLPIAKVENIAGAFATALKMQNTEPEFYADICDYPKTPLLIIPAMRIMRQTYMQHSDKTLKNRFIEERFLSESLHKSLRASKIREENLNKITLLIQIMTAVDKNLNYAIDSSVALYLEYLFSDLDVQHFCGVNKFERNVYFNKERFEQLMGWLTLITSAETQNSKSLSEKDKIQRIKDLKRLKEYCIKSATAAGYQLGELLKTV